MLLKDLTDEQQQPVREQFDALAKITKEYYENSDVVLENLKLTPIRQEFDVVKGLLNSQCPFEIENNIENDAELLIEEQRKVDEEIARQLALQDGAQALADALQVENELWYNHLDDEDLGLNPVPQPNRTPNRTFRGFFGSIGSFFAGIFRRDP